MTELFEEAPEDGVVIAEEDEIIEVEEGESIEHSFFSDARRRLENLLDEQKLRNELKDFLDD